uniref:PH domain-containing protein n=1 Tax=Anopheles atroparvus TaxID=41427 RepID=A0A182JM62_ANOAO
MFSCLWQLWDWIDPPNFTTMESKKLQQLQQANSHLAPMPQMKPPQQGGGFQQPPPPGGYDYGTTGRSPMFVAGGGGPSQYQGFATANFTQLNHPSAALRSPYSTGSPKSSLSTNSGALYGATADGEELSSVSGGTQHHQHLHPPGPSAGLHHHHQQFRGGGGGGSGSSNNYGFEQQLYHRVSSPSSGGSAGERERLYQRPPGAAGAPAGSETDKILSRTHAPASYHGTLDSGGLHQQSQPIYGEAESLYQKGGSFSTGPSPMGGGAGGNSEIIIQQNIPGQVVNQACQTQISSMILGGGGTGPGQVVKSSPSDTLSSPSHDSIERKRSSGGSGGSGQQHTLKSPVTKRPANAPVALSGWLYKQGSDGLKVWRRRWFVLSEYVLYYYKGMEEEKLLGTVLLPSYKVSACFPEDKIYRKFAFKCEHANMRTFVFAAENAAAMSSNDTMKLIQQASGNGSSGSSGGGGLEAHQGATSANESMPLPQPLYANAPPKPRRVNDAGYSSPSPEHTILQDRYEQHMMQHQQHNDRRTPDTYGPPGNAGIDPKHMSDYEDIYNLTMLSKSLPSNAAPAGGPLEGGGATGATGGGASYKRPSSPLQYGINGAFPPFKANSVYTANPFENAPVTPMQQHVQIRARPIPPNIPRPHSADFLDYETRHPMNPAANSINDEPSPSLRTPRPKSSLDINRTPDHYYYSEASYAEKMRLQSASYLQRANNAAAAAGVSRKQRSDDIQGLFAGGTIPRDGLYRSGSGKLIPSHQQNQPTESDFPEGSQSMPRPSTTDRPTGVSRPSVSSLKKQGFSHQQQQEQFARSASARLPRKEEDPSLRDGERKREESMKRLLEWKQRMLQSPLTKKITSQHSASMASAESLDPDSHASLAGGIDRSHEDIYGLKPNDALLRGDYYAATYERQSIGDLTAVGSGRSVGSERHSGSTLNIAQQAAYGSEMKLNGDYNSYSSDDEGRFGWSLAQLQRAQELNLQQHYQLQNIDRSLATMQDRQHPDASPQSPMVGSGGGPAEMDEKWTNGMLTSGSVTTPARGGQGGYMHDRHKHGPSGEMQNLIRTAEGERKADSLARLDALKQQLTELEKQYEKEKPLINLVDNMVKLGSLYRGPAGGKKQLQSPESATLDRLEFNQRMQERRLLQEEQRQWDRTSPNHVELQSKVQQLYQIDKLMQEESGTLQALQRDKENLEKALATLKTRVLNREGGGSMPMPMDTARQQQHNLERELSRVHQLLAANSKKLEKTVSTNARLEQELLVLRQKLQATREHRSMHSVYDTASHMDSHYVTGSVTAVLESELKRAKLLVGDMQRQRQELGQAVRQLTSYGDVGGGSVLMHRHQTLGEQHQQAHGDSEQQQQHKREQTMKSKHKRSYSSSWVETDLDSTTGKESSSSVASTGNHRAMSSSSSSVLTIDDEMQNLFLPTGGRTHESSLDGAESMDELYSIGGGVAYGYGNGGGPGGIMVDKQQEIKTVRIVKRESERRTRDKEKNDRNLALSLDQVLEEEAQLMEDYQRAKSLPRGYETHELFVQGPEADGRMGGSMGAIDGGRLMNDYYSSVVASANGNSYPVSLIDRQADLYTGHFETGLQSKYITNGAASGGPARTTGLAASYQQSVNYATGTTTTTGLKRKTESIQSLNAAGAEFDPVFQSEAAKQIINEMATGAVGNISGSGSSSSNGGMMNVNWRARDDVDLEVTIRPRSNAPDVVRSALGPREKISEHTIDKLLAAPSKILIPERYVPEQTPELSPEEKRRRQEKVEAIKKMLSDTPIGSGAAGNEAGPNPVPNAEKKQREHLIQLNQILAQQVMQMSKIVAEDKTPTLVKYGTNDVRKEDSSAVLPSKIKRRSGSAFGAAATGSKSLDEKDNYESDLEDYDTDSPAEPLPLYQQRENYFT